MKYIFWLAIFWLLLDRARHPKHRLQLNVYFGVPGSGNSGVSYRIMSQKTGFAMSSFHYEIQRDLYNYLDGGTWKTAKRYSADIAQADAEWQATVKGCPVKLGNNHAYAKTIANRIRSGESPDQVVGRLRLESKWTVSTNTLDCFHGGASFPRNCCRCSTTSFLLNYQKSGLPYEMKLCEVNS